MSHAAKNERKSAGNKNDDCANSSPKLWRKGTGGSYVDPFGSEGVYVTTEPVR